MVDRGNPTASHNKRVLAVPTSEEDAASTTAVEESHHAGGTVSAAVFGIVKAMVGPAILYLPHSFADAGYAFALVALACCLAMYLYSSNKLLESWSFVAMSQQQEAKRTTVSNGTPHDGTKNSASDGDDEIEMVSLTVSSGTTAETLADVNTINDLDDKLRPVTNEADGILVNTVSITYHQLAQMAYGNLGGIAIRTGIALMQLGVCLTYFIFVPHNLSASLKSFGLNIPMWLGLVAMVVLEIPLCWIRDIRKLVYTNVAANCLIFFGLASCLYLALFVSDDSDNKSTEMAQLPQEATNTANVHETSATTPVVESSEKSAVGLSPWNDRWYLFIGTSIFLFEGSITLCLPLQEALDSPDAATKFPIVYKKTIAGIVFFYSFFGLICWTGFGNSVDTVLTVSLPDGVLATLVQLFYSVAVIFTFPLQIFPASEIVVQLVQKLAGGDDESNVHLSSLQRRLLVAAMLIVLSIVAVVEMDNLGSVISLMGSLVGCPLAFVFPPLIHNRVVPSAPITKNYIIAGLGMLAMVGASLTTLATWGNGEGGRRLIDMR